MGDSPFDVFESVDGPIRYDAQDSLWARPVLSSFERDVCMAVFLFSQAKHVRCVVICKLSFELVG